MSTHSLQARIRREIHRVQGDKLLATIKDLVHAGNTRRIIIKDANGQTVLEVPLSLGVAAALLRPTWIAIAAIAALAADFTVIGEQHEADGADSD